MPLINCEINLLLIWSADGVIIAGAKKLKKYLKEQLNGININQKHQIKHKIDI